MTLISAVLGADGLITVNAQMYDARICSTHYSHWIYTHQGFCIHSTFHFKVALANLVQCKDYNSLVCILLLNSNLRSILILSVIQFEKMFLYPILYKTRIANTTVLFS